MSEYRVLARKYRPQRLGDLVGQDVLIRTLTNAFNTGRLAHAFLLTGIRGIGKTTTARIIARSLNCLGADGTLDKPTPEPCGTCANCLQIAEDRHVDVLEMDAASRTGVADVREIIETVHYKPTSARYKVYIIDEVHMLSTQAFNALLKTLEEPPPHVIFVFATTETRKIPVTILSRCQRFDLRRIGVEEMVAHLSSICAKESVSAEEEALKLIAIASEGSARDALSLLDQAIAHSMEGQSIHVQAETVRSMLGVADRSRLFGLLDAAFSGQPQSAMALLGEHYRAGGDMVLLLGDMLALVHALSRLNLTPGDDLGPSYSEHEKRSARDMAAKLDVPTLSLTWQMLLKGLEETKRAPDPLMCAEMLMLRLTHATSLPRPSELMRQAQQEMPAAPIGQAFSTPEHARNFSPPSAVPTMSGGATARKMEPVASLEPYSPHTPEPKLSLIANHPLAVLEQFEDLLSLVEQKREPTLLHHLVTAFRLVSFREGEIFYARESTLPVSFTRDLAAFLKRHTGREWSIVAKDEAGNATVAERKKASYEQARVQAESHPLVREALATFPGARIVEFEPEETRP